ncbi:hypothetical protein Tco_0580479 [Tanacetum coccineum]
MYKGRSFTTARIAILSLSLIFLMIIIIIKDYDGSVEFEHSAFPRLSAAQEGPEEELAPKQEIRGVEGPEKELAFQK